VRLDRFIDVNCEASYRLPGVDHLSVNLNKPKCSSREYNEMASLKGLQEAVR